MTWHEVGFAITMMVALNLAIVGGGQLGKGRATTAWLMLNVCFVLVFVAFYVFLL